MASAALHIKDSYYFEVPKMLWRSNRRDKSEFPWVWVKNDPEYQAWEADRLVKELGAFGVPDGAKLRHDWHHWQHNHANFGKPLDVYLDEQVAALKTQFQSWKAKAGEVEKETTFLDWLAKPENSSGDLVWFAKQLESQETVGKWNEVKVKAASEKGAFADFKASSIDWSPEKIASYNKHLSGKILIPQPFGELKNLYEREPGQICISKFMIVEVVVFLILAVIFSWLGRRMVSGDAPKGRLWNLLEGFLVFIRDEIARKAIHDDHGHGHDEHAHDSHSGHDAHAGHGHAAAHAVAHVHAADKFVPLLWTLFFFILGCNLMGMLPWLGSPTGTFGVTLALAGVTFVSCCVFGSIKFGVVGFFLNQIPHMDLPLVLAVILKPMIFAIEMLGFLIKHLVLAIRLLANMVAGHLVLLAIMGMAFSLEGALSSTWPVMAVVSVLASTLFSCLELFVAFLQAYVFTFLSALFIGAATSRH